MTSVVDVHIGILVTFIGPDCEIVDVAIEDKADFSCIAEQMVAQHMRLA